MTPLYISSSLLHWISNWIFCNCFLWCISSCMSQYEKRLGHVFSSFPLHDVFFMLRVFDCCIWIWQITSAIIFVSFNPWHPNYTKFLFNFLKNRTVLFESNTSDLWENITSKKINYIQSNKSLKCAGSHFWVGIVEWLVIWGLSFKPFVQQHTKLNPRIYNLKWYQPTTLIPNFWYFIILFNKLFQFFENNKKIFFVNVAIEEFHWETSMLSQEFLLYLCTLIILWKFHQKFFKNSMNALKSNEIVGERNSLRHNAVHDFISSGE